MIALKTFTPAKFNKFQYKIEGPNVRVQYTASTGPYHAAPTVVSKELHMQIYCTVQSVLVLWMKWERDSVGFALLLKFFLFLSFSFFDKQGGILYVMPEHNKR